MVIIYLDFIISPTSRRGTSTQVILLLLRRVTPRREMTKMPSVIQSSVISVVVCMELSSMHILISAMGATRVGILSATTNR